MLQCFKKTRELYLWHYRTTNNENYNQSLMKEDLDSFKALVPIKADRDNIKKEVANETEGNNAAKGTDC